MSSMIDSKKKNVKRKRGRPSGSRTTFIGPAIGLRLYPDQETQVNDWIARQDDNPSRPEAIRRLVQLGLGAEAPAKPRRPGKRKEGE
jgi:hypothetical protein